MKKYSTYVPVPEPVKVYNSLYVSVYLLSNLEPPQFVIRDSREVYPKTDEQTLKIVEELHLLYKRSVCLIIPEKRVGELEKKVSR